MNELFGELIGPILSNPAVILARQLCTLFFVVFWVALVFWTWRDAKLRGAMSWFWGLVTALFFIPGWIIYMVVRPPEYADDAHERELEIQAKEAEIAASMSCPSCLKPIESDFLICPSCMKKLRKECVECGKALKLDWGVCPYCKTKQ